MSSALQGKRSGRNAVKNLFAPRVGLAYALTSDQKAQVQKHIDDQMAKNPATAFKLMTDPFVGQLTFVRVYSGKLESGGTVFNAKMVLIAAGGGSFQPKKPPIPGIPMPASASEPIHIMM